MSNVTEAILSLVPNASFSVGNDSVDEISWYSDDVVQPTKNEILEELDRLNAVYASQQYQRDRKAAYPSIEDQLDDLYHNGIEGWKATIKAIKDTYPKE